MIQTLLDANRIRAGSGLSLEFQYCDLSDVINKTYQDLVNIYGQRFSFVKPEPILGVWSSEGIRRALENLATNAVKYGSSGTPITIVLTQESDTAILSVHNEGKEIEQADQAKLFDSFFRTDSAEQRKIIGWGLGLALVKGVAEAHGGTVTVESKKDFGTTFSLRIPIRMDATA
jgi:signal transduction histidine kinase